MMGRMPQLDHGLMVSSAVMLIGIVLLIGPALLALAVPPWWTRAMALLIVSGACAELAYLWRFCRTRM